MSPSGTVMLKAVWEMLDGCAPGWERTKTNHHWRVTYNGRTYPTLPLGPHGPREHVEIQVLHVRRMARMLEILQCAKERLPALR
jgi:hypothetical protein